jgi:hypothetical protein
MLDKIHEVLKNKYNLTQEEIELEDNLWHNRIIQCWGIDAESEPTESEAEAKRKQKEYQHEYYITHRKKSTKVLIMSDTAIKNRATMTKLRNRICLYEGETVKYGTLMARMHNKLGYSWPEAKKIADEHLLK